MRAILALLLAFIFHVLLLSLFSLPKQVTLLEGQSLHVRFGADVAEDSGPRSGSDAETASAAPAQPNSVASEPQNEVSAVNDTQPQPRSAPPPNPVRESQAAPVSEPSTEHVEQAPIEPAPSDQPSIQPLPQPQTPKPVVTPSGSTQSTSSSEQETSDTGAKSSFGGDVTGGSTPESTSAVASGKRTASGDLASGTPSDETDTETVAAALGNAASTNYAGKVMQHLSRVRRPRASSPGSAIVVFKIDYHGQISAISISKSSGSSRFDRDALKVVERAAPFPVPPKGVRRDFTVEIKGR